MDEKFNLLGNDILGNPIKRMGGVLHKKFIQPPFSVLDTRLGPWQSRKRAWLKLGIESELGRGGKGHQTKTYNIQDWMRSHESKNNFWENDGATGISIFDPVLCELMYEWFCPNGGQIIDPFAGGSVRGIVAAVMGYRYWGCDLSGKQIEANREQASQICPDSIIRWVKGDAKKELSKAPEADFLFTCPLYGDLEVYGDDPADLSNMEFSQFQKTYSQIIKQACDKLRADRFACIVVGDYRDKHGNYRCFPQLTIQAFLDAGLFFYNDVTLINPAGSLSIRITKQFESGRKIGKMHQNVLVFVKGDPKKATGVIKGG